MEKLFPTMTLRVEKPATAVTIFYGFFGFLVIPFVSMLLLGDSWKNMQWRSWFEFGCHLLHFLFALAILRNIVSDSTMNVQLNVASFLGVTALGIVMMLAVSSGSFLLAALSGSELLISTADWMLPLFEKETVMMADFLVADSPVLGLICMGILAPVGVSCIFYAVGFAPTCEDHPLLAYLVVAVVLALPRLCNVILFQPVEYELAMYIFQLPLHWIACWTFQKTDSIWAPIAVLSVTNLMHCRVLTFG